MIKSIDDIRKELKETIWPFNIFVLKNWADSIINECANNFECDPNDDENGHPALNRSSILRVKNMIV